MTPKEKWKGLSRLSRNIINSSWKPKQGFHYTTTINKRVITLIENQKKLAIDLENIDVFWRDGFFSYLNALHEARENNNCQGKTILHQQCFTNLKTCRKFSTRHGFKLP